MPSATATAPRLVPAIAGDRLPAAAIERGAAFVEAPCGERRDLTAAAFYCLSCNQPLANLCQLDMHLETGEHVIARSCHLHGWEAF